MAVDDPLLGYPPRLLDHRNIHTARERQPKTDYATDNDNAIDFAEESFAVVLWPAILRLLLYHAFTSFALIPNGNIGPSSNIVELERVDIWMRTQTGPEENKIRWTPRGPWTPAEESISDLIDCPLPASPRTISKPLLFLDYPSRLAPRKGYYRSIRGMIGT